MEKPVALEELIQALRCLPGVGPKSAQRMAYHLLQRDQKGAHLHRTDYGQLPTQIQRARTGCGQASEARVVEPRPAVTVQAQEVACHLSSLELLETVA